MNKLLALGAAAAAVVSVPVVVANLPPSGGSSWPSLARLSPMAEETAPTLVFVSRKINEGGSIYYPAARDMPGIGPHSRFDMAAPGSLLLRLPSGEIKVLVAPADETADDSALVDVNAPDVSYDGRQIVFAGLSLGALKARRTANGYVGLGPEGYAGGWRIYVIDVDGSNLRRLTGEEANRQARIAAANLPTSLAAFDDGDPIWLPNGAIAFSSTRWPSFAQYSGVRTSNLYTIAADGTDLRRITAERNGADRPMVDPLTGKIVYARWWRNHRFPVNSLETIRVRDSKGNEIPDEFVQKDGLTQDRQSLSPNAESMFRNAWHAASIRPDGSDLEMWSGQGRNDAANHMYGGAFTSDGRLYANFFPMYNMTEAGGFGGIRLLERGPKAFTPVMGITDITGDQTKFVARNSYGVYKLAPGQYYASEPAVLPDGRLVVSLAANTNQDYGLYIVNADGTGVTPLFDAPGSSELRAKVVAPRPTPRALPLASGSPPALMPPGEGPDQAEGVFSFEALNIYFNAPVDTPIVSAPAIGSGAKIRFFADYQRKSAGSFPGRDWPILLGEKTISPNGAVFAQAPAGVPLFEQLRSPDGTVPLTDGPFRNGSAHVAGMNFSLPGTRARCVGCHAGHTLMKTPDQPEDAIFTNLAPGARVTASSVRDPTKQTRGVNDRQVKMGSVYDYWAAATPPQGDVAGNIAGEWVQLTFPVAIETRAIVLYNPRFEKNKSELQITSAKVELCADEACAVVTGEETVGSLSSEGTPLLIARPKVRAVRVSFGSATGLFLGAKVAALAEVEVIAKGQEP